MDDNIEGLSPEDEKVLEGISSGKIMGVHTITLTFTLPPDDYERMMKEPPEMIEKWRQTALEKALEEIPPGSLASNERLDLEVEFLRGEDK